MAAVGALMLAAISARPDDIVVRRFSDGSPRTVSFDLPIASVAVDGTTIRATATGIVNGRPAGLVVTVFHQRRESLSPLDQVSRYRFYARLDPVEVGPEGLEAILVETFGLAKPSNLFKAYDTTSIIDPLKWADEGGWMFFGDPADGDGYTWHVVLNYDAAESTLNINVTRS